MRHPLLTPLALALSACAAPAVGPAPGVAEPPVRNVIFLLVDGGGPGLWTAARLAQDELAVDRMPVLGLVDTRSASHKVTDSAAGATAYSTGERVSNRTIAVSPDCPVAASGDTVTAGRTACAPLPTWFALARDRGKATGVVTTTAVVDASPAAFVAHSPSRYWTGPIASQVADFGLDVLLGGGRRYFEAATRNDRRELYASLCANATCITTGAELAAYRPDDRPLVGLFAPGDMDDDEPRSIALPEMVAAALTRLERDPDGFVALFESESTDVDTHANAPIEKVTAHILEFDRAVGVALDFAARHPGTLAIVTGDHETGGLSLRERGTDFEIAYTTGGHTAAMVPLFASGPQAERFAGLVENREVGRILMEIARGW